MGEHSCCHFDIDVNSGVIIYFPVNRAYCFEPPIDNEKLLDLYKIFVMRDKPCTTREERNIVKLLNITDYRKTDKSEKLYFNTERICLKYCPYCGKKLPPTLNDEYFMCIDMDYGPEYLPGYANRFWSPRDNMLFKAGFPEPKPLPDEFKSDEWWKKRGLKTEKDCVALRRKYYKWCKQHPTDWFID